MEAQQALRDLVDTVQLLQRKATLAERPLLRLAMELLELCASTEPQPCMVELLQVEVGQQKRWVMDYLNQQKGNEQMTRLADDFAKPSEDHERLLLRYCQETWEGARAIALVLDFFYTIQAVIVIRGIIEGGIGQHANDIDQTEITIGFQTWYFGELIYPVLSCLTKTSVTLFLQQAYIVKFQTREATNRRYIQWVLYICLCAIWTSSNVFLSASIFQCSPPSHYWMQFEDPSSEGTCSKSIVPAAGIVLSIVTAASDWALASVPIVALTKTQIPWRKKAAIQALSSLGVV
ncbi:hypothetical protein RAB80_014474 [Fusarium oxysporum f. sp. vasinfectum]|nr:hypothetical protein RAB80_014474 [Fusarium oxysporum f. sp. vasinfectum]